MQKQLKIYLDTSVINFLFADDAPEKKEITTDLFDNFIKTGIYETFISDVVIGEIENTKNPDKKNKLLNIINTYPIEIVAMSKPIETEITILAQKYITAGIIPLKKRPDALHISVCTVCNIPYLVSWNYKHLANINKERQVQSINLQNNYIQELRIITPLELIYYGN